MQPLPTFVQVCSHSCAHFFDFGLSLGGWARATSHVHEVAVRLENLRALPQGGGAGGGRHGREGGVWRAQHGGGRENEWCFEKEEWQKVCPKVFWKTKKRLLDGNQTTLHERAGVARVTRSRPHFATSLE